MAPQKAHRFPRTGPAPAITPDRQHRRPDHPQHRVPRRPPPTDHPTRVAPRQGARLRHPHANRRTHGRPPPTVVSPLPRRSPTTPDDSAPHPVARTPVADLRTRAPQDLAPNHPNRTRHPSPSGPPDDSHLARPQHHRQPDHTTRPTPGRHLATHSRDCDHVGPSQSGLRRLTQPAGRRPTALAPRRRDHPSQPRPNQPTNPTERTPGRPTPTRRHTPHSPDGDPHPQHHRLTRSAARTQPRTRRNTSPGSNRPGNNSPGVAHTRRRALT